MKRLLRDIAVILGIITVILILMPDTYYIFGGDGAEQGVPFTLYFYHLFREEGWSWWNWSISYGGSNVINFFTVLGSPSFWIFMILPEESWIFPCFWILNVIRCLMIAAFSWLWLSRIVKSEKARYAGAMIMTFCGWIMCWQHLYYYAESWLYVCILLYSMEELLAGKKKWLFVIINALMVILYVYMAYMSAWLILFYLIVRLQMLNPEERFSGILKRLLRPFLLYLLGIALSSAVFVPELYVLLSEKRVAGDIPALLSDPANVLISLKTAWRFLSGLFSPVMNDYECTMFASAYETGDHLQTTMTIYSFILFLVLFPQMFRMQIGGKKPVLRMMLFLTLCAMFPWIYILFNGNINNRWAFYYIIFNVMCVVLILEHEKELDRRLLRRTGACVVLLYAIFSAAAVLLNQIGAEKQKNLLLVPLMALLTILYVKVLEQGSFRELRILMMTEALLCIGCRIVNYGTQITLIHGQNGRLYQEQMLNRDVTENLKEQYPGFYRIETDEPLAVNYLLPLAKNYKGSSYYYGLYNPSMDRYYENRISANWHIPYSQSKFLSETVFGQRFLVTYSADTFVPYGYTLSDHIEENPYDSEIPISVYENSVNVGLGFADDKLYSDPASDFLDKSVQDFAMTQGILCSEGTEEFTGDDRFRKLSESLENEVIELGEHETGTLIVDYSSTYPNSYLNYEFYQDGKVVSYVHTEEYGYRAIRVPADIDEVGIYCVNADFTSSSISASVYFITDSDLESVYEEMKEKDQFTNVSQKHGNLSADITITGTENKLAMVSIPYNEGWTVLVDGKKTDTESADLCMTGFWLTPGKHQVEFIFTPQGLHAGILISAAALACFLFLMAADRKKNQISD